MDYVFAPPPQASIAVANSDARLPVRRIFCVGRNYAAHAREMGMDDRDPPFFFTKPADAVVDAGSTIPYPPETNDLNHEVELIAVIGTGGRDIAVEDSLSHVWGYAIGNDFTRRDIQIALREVGRPWDWGKAFDNSAVIGPAHPVSEVGHPAEGFIRLTVNGEVRQDGNLNEMIWNVPEVISIISRSMELKPGDLIMSGTPAGVGPVKPGDVLVHSIVGLGEVTVTIGPRA
jgi:fumarylpyruvate hydrolase